MGSPSFDVGSRIIAAFQAGAEEKRRANEQVQQQEERKLRMDALRHALQREKLTQAYEDQSSQQQLADQTHQLVASALPDRLLPGSAGPAQTGSGLASPGTPINPGGDAANVKGAGPVAPVASAIPGRIEPTLAPEITMTRPGINIPELGLSQPSIDLPLESPAEQARKVLKWQREQEMNKPQKLGPDETFGFPGEKPLMQGGVKEPTGDYGKYFLPAYAAKLGKKPEQLSPDESIGALQAFASDKADPEMRAAALAQKNLAMSLERMQLAQQPTPEQAKQVAEDLVAHRIAPEQTASMFGGFGTAGQSFKRMVYGEAKKLDPNFDFEQASAEYQLTKSPSFQTTVRYMASVQNSIPRVLQTATTLANGNVKSISSLVNAGKNQFNNIDLKKFQTDALLVSDEIGKILAGGGTGSVTSDNKLTQAQSILGQNDSPAAIKAALEEVNSLIGFRRKALTKGTYLENANLGEAPATAPTSGTRQVKMPDGTVLSFPGQ